jgi:hypothetical protein
MQYRCYYFGASDQLLGADTIVQESDSDALAVARKLFAQHAHAMGYELRQRNRLVASQELPSKSRRQVGTSRAA